MRPIVIDTLAVAFLAVLLAAPTPAFAQRGSNDVSEDGSYSVRLETLGGRPLPTYRHRGTTFVEGRYGDRYAIRVFNHSARRVEAVITVDGRDVVSGRVGDYRGCRGYVIEPWGSVRIEGFRTSLDGVAAFRFTDVPDSYAARLGDARNVGIVGVALFREQERPIWRHQHSRRPTPAPRLGTGYGAADEAPAASPAAGGLRAKSRAAEAESSGLGTGYGEEVDAPAVEVPFRRADPGHPDELLAMVYDDREGLAARGVLTRPRPHPRPIVPVGPHPFPESRDPRFAPPPPSRDWD